MRAAISLLTVLVVSGCLCGDPSGISEEQWEAIEFKVQTIPNADNVTLLASATNGGPDTLEFNTLCTPDGPWTWTLEGPRPFVLHRKGCWTHGDTPCGPRGDDELLEAETLHVSFNLDGTWNVTYLQAGQNKFTTAYLPEGNYNWTAAFGPKNGTSKFVYVRDEPVRLPAQGLPGVWFEARAYSSNWTIQVSLVNEGNITYERSQHCLWGTGANLGVQSRAVMPTACPEFPDRLVPGQTWTHWFADPGLAATSPSDDFYERTWTAFFYHQDEQRRQYLWTEIPFLLSGRWDRSQY